MCVIGRLFIPMQDPLDLKPQTQCSFFIHSKFSTRSKQLRFFFPTEEKDSSFANVNEVIFMCVRTRRQTRTWYGNKLDFEKYEISHPVGLETKSLRIIWKVSTWLLCRWNRIREESHRVMKSWEQTKRQVIFEQSRRFGITRVIRHTNQLSWY